LHGACPIFTDRKAPSIRGLETIPQDHRSTYRATTPLGAPVFLSTTTPLSVRPLNRLVVAQDTGTAIKGAVRADFFWGFGDEAGQSAGRMRQTGRMWILYPRGFQPKPP